MLPKLRRENCITNGDTVIFQQGKNTVTPKEFLKTNRLLDVERCPIQPKDNNVSDCGFDILAHQRALLQLSMSTPYICTANPRDSNTAPA